METIEVTDDVTPQPCPDICMEETCEECSDHSCPAPTTASYNEALGGLGVMAFASGSNARVQNFSHNAGQGEATLDYIVTEAEENIMGFDNNHRQQTVFGNGVLYFTPIVKPKVIKVARNQKQKTPNLVKVELLQYGPLLFKEPKTIFFDTKNAKAGESYRFSIPVDVKSLPTGVYDWQATITRIYADNSSDQSTVTGRQGIFNNSGSAIGKGWVFGLLPKLVKDGNDIIFYYRGMHKFSNVKGKWVANQTYDLSDNQLTGDWINGFKLTVKDKSFRTFNAEGQVISETDNAGNRTHYEYNDAGQLSKKITPQKNTTEFRYDKEFRLTFEIDATGKRTAYNHDALNRRTKIIANDKQTTEIFHDYAGREAYSKNQFGIINGKSFDPVDRVVAEFYFEPGNIKLKDAQLKSHDPQGVTWTATNLEPNKCYEILASWKVDGKKSHSSEYIVKTENNIILSKPADQTVSAGFHPIAGKDYRSLGIIVTKNGTVDISLETENLIISDTIKIVEVKPQAIYRYNNSGNLAESIDQLGNVTRYEYDKLDRQTKTITQTLDPKHPESVTETIFDLAGNISKRIDPYGFETEFFYNPFGKVVKIIQTDNDLRGTIRKLVTENRYNKFDQLIETINPAGQKISYKYNLYGQQIEITNALGHVTKTEYDKRGNIVTEIDAAGNKTIHKYDLPGRRIATILPKPSDKEPSPISRQFFNWRGQLSATISPDGVVKTFSYNKYAQTETTYLGVLQEITFNVKDGQTIFIFDNLLPDAYFNIFISWKKSQTVGEKTTVKLNHTIDGKSTAQILGEIDLSKNPNQDTFFIPFSLDSYQQIGENVKSDFSNFTISFSGELKNISVYMLRVQPENQ
ncbi:MAG: hypothetical protein LBC74_09480, partial [Planctomycetaceae bacterium]|nr:hypothetical protein [Planctomycetaceae bacterium]